MSFSWSSWWSTTEQDVVAILSKIKADAIIAEADIDKALKWVASQTPAIVGDLQIALQLAQAVGVVTAPELAAANLAVTALNAFAKASNAGKSDAQSVVTGYLAVAQANAAVSAAKAAAVATTVKK